MKLRSIALAGLLGAGLIMTSGCTEDDVKDVLGVNASAVYVVNDLDANITAEVEDIAKLVETMGMAVVFPTASTDDSLNVHYIQGGPDIGDVEVANDGVYIYAATNCNGNTHLVDKYNGNKIRLMNLSSSPIATGKIELVHSSGSYTLEELTGCGVASTFIGSTIGTWAVTIDGKSYPVTDVTKDVAFEIVVYEYDDSANTNSATIVPLLGFDDIL